MKQTSEFAMAVAGKKDVWVPACGGHEQPFTYAGTRYLYCFNPQRHEHSYLNLDTDVIEPWPPFLN